MWKCLPFIHDARDDHEIALLKKDDDAIPTKVFVAEAGARTAAVQRMVRSQCTGVSLWFTYLVDYLGQALVTYFHRMVEKVEKLEYYD